ncbi:fatty acid desaturase family protein [Chitinophaga sp. GCM10012297]|uniref:Acyl-CoA desaturase n=1 Tax=Chitinophaga chungangae TaxID=2821488 RepID=A0ABS3YBS3_9BACT|nr:acyl-CoA desaturase [Chitinophaga chungangae]MBO9152135.1 acyl-CoA desaturase [Chitinophaga chungangae]
MKANKLDIVRFASKGDGSFYDTVKARAKAYFERHNISPYANAQMWVKTACMLALYFVPYIFLITGVAGGNGWIFFMLWFLMGLGMSGIGTAVMHDANHGTYSANKNTNKFIAYILEVIGGYTVNWKIQHNILHHTYTNISGLDEDIDTMGLIRLSPNQPVKWYHRYQHLYAWFFYMIMTLYWMTAKDFFQVARYKKFDLLIKQKLSLTRAMWQISLYKTFYYCYVLVLPLIFSGMPWYFVIAGFLLMHFTAGLLLSCIFQPSHIMETSDFAVPVYAENKRQMENSWAVHEIENTTNFAPKNRILSWFAGGLNRQIEHHLFSDICHVHYRKLAPIVKSTAREFGLPYNEQRTFLKALRAHAVMLKKLGRGTARPAE